MWKRKQDNSSSDQYVNQYDDYNDSYSEQEDILQKIHQQQLQNDLKPKTAKRTKSKEYYVKGADLKQQIRKYQQSKRLDAQQRGVPYQQGNGIMSEQLGQMIIKICTRFSMHPRFYGYSFRDQFVADAVTRCITHGVGKINLDLPNCNPFSYFTQIAYNIFRQKIKSEKKYSLTKQKLREQVYTQFELQNGMVATKDNQD